MSFNKLDTDLDSFIHTLNQSISLTIDIIKSIDVLQEFNSSSYLLTLHDVEYYRPIFINNAMKIFYGFKSNELKGLNYLYYLKTIHISSYNSLVASVAFFRNDKKNTCT